MKIPVPPEPARNLRRLHAAWAGMFEPRHQEPLVIPDEATPSPIRPFATSLFGPGNSRWEKSLNWSGSYVVPHDSRIATIIFGEWRTPEVSLPPDVDQDLCPSGYAVSTWIGIDGNRRYLNATLPQIGTLQKIRIDATGNRTSKTLVFQQWWRRDDPCSLWRLIGSVPVRPGDTIRCAVWIACPQSAYFYLKVNNDRPHGLKDSVPQLNGLPTPTVTGATAEWIVERPTIPRNTKLYGFPHYADISFGSCIVGTGRDIPDYDKELDLSGARYVKMYERRRWPSRTALVSVPKRVDRESFAVINGGFAPR